MLFAGSRLGLVLASVAVLCWTSGCGGPSGPDLTPVSGTVTYEGKPVGPGTVAFVPTDANTNPASGNIDASGNFKMSVYKPGDGVFPGTYKVSVTVEKEPAHGDAQGNLYPPTYLSPERYMNPDTSGFTVTVESRKSQHLKFDLLP